VLWFYRFLFLPALILTLPAYLRRMFRRGGYRDGFFGRFGRVEGLPAKRPGVRRVWIQAVSVGEMLAIAPVLQALRRRNDIEVYLTTTTTTGAAQARERYAGLVAAIGYFPLDFWPLAVRAWRRVQPDLVVLTESEFWPEHLHQAARRRVPVLCINGRLSDRSFARMMRLRGLVRPLARGITRVLACSQLDGARFAELGLPGVPIDVVGSIKLDVEIPRLDDRARAVLRAELGLPAEGLVLLGSSTWPGEEVALVGTLQRVRAAGVACSLVLVPRHAERREEIVTLLRATGLRFHLRSTGPAPGVVDVAVGDTTGELRKFTQLADLVFVGKSLSPHVEGQTPVEAAILEKPILFGPGMSNFREIVAGLVMSGGARVVHDPEELSAVALRLLRSPGERGTMAGAFGSWHAANRGAIDKTTAAIVKLLGLPD
jgi:3-deoxy-D-manno-octulosonic-acid transferase